MRCPLASLPRAVWVLLLIFFLVTLTASHPAVVPEDSSLSSNNIAAVADTGDITDLLESGEHTTPIATKIPTKAETAHQLNTYRVKPLTIAHQIEGLLTLFGLGKQTNFILDTLCLLAYAHLLRLTSQSSWYSMELVQFVGFFLFPALPFVQFANNLCRTIMNVLHDGNSGVRHALSCIIGQYATSAQPTSSQLSVLDEKAEGVEPSQPSDLFVRQRLTHVPQHELNSSSGVALHIVRRFGGILLAGLTITASITTLHIHVDHPVRSDWDSVGIASDQRHGWLAGGATLASLLSVIALVTNSRWTIKSDFTRPDTRAGILAEGEVSHALDMRLTSPCSSVHGKSSIADSYLDLHRTRSFCNHSGSCCRLLRRRLLRRLSCRHDRQYLGALSRALLYRNHEQAPFIHS